jgi:hypothetical protein
MPSHGVTPSKRLDDRLELDVASRDIAHRLGEDRVWRSTSASVVAGDMRAMLWKGVIRTPRLSA